MPPAKGFERFDSRKWMSLRVKGLPLSLQIGNRCGNLGGGGGEFGILSAESFRESLQKVFKMRTFGHSRWIAKVLELKLNSDVYKTSKL